MGVDPTIVSLACQIAKLKQWGKAWERTAAAKKEEIVELRTKLSLEVESLREEIAGLRGIVKERDGLLTQAQDQRDSWKRSFQDLSKSAHRELTEVREQRNVWREMLGALPQESLTEAINRVVAERDDLRKIVEMVHADLGIQPGDHIGEAISELKKEASDATARQRMTEARALNYSLQADEARREIERLRAKLNAKTVEWPEWAKVGARVRVRSNDCTATQNSDRVVGEELVIAKVDRRDWTIRAESWGWVHVSDLEPVAEHTQPAVAVQS